MTTPAIECPTCAAGPRKPCRNIRTAAHLPIANPHRSRVIADALTRECEVCGSRSGSPCRSLKSGGWDHLADKPRHTVRIKVPHRERWSS